MAANNYNYIRENNKAVWKFLESQSGKSESIFMDQLSVYQLSVNQFFRESIFILQMTLQNDKKLPDL